MKILKIFMLLSCIYSTTAAQYIIKGKITDSQNEPIIGATVTVKYDQSSSNNSNVFGTSTSNEGLFTIANIAKNKVYVSISFLGMQTVDSLIVFTAGTYLLNVALQSNDEDLEEVIIQSTRTSRNIGNIPTRIEVIELEEIDEKTNMRPGNVSMLLHESTGIQVQQTSATTASASIRIQGLDGKYTQILKDGFASFGNFASGLSVLEIPPLDLAQVEIIKGPASTLYGAGAIAGVVNFISKTPQQKPQVQAIISQSHVGQSSIGVFASNKYTKLGYTLLAQANYQKAYDVDKDDFTELPESKDVNLHPKLFLYPNEQTTIILGNAFAQSKRVGGDIQVINHRADGQHSYFEANNTIRNTSTAELKHSVGDNQLTVKQSFSYFDRSITIPQYTFAGSNYNAFTDASYLIKKSKHSTVLGQNFVYDKFVERQNTSARNNSLYTAGMYVQHTWDISPKNIIEAGLRGDAATYQNTLLHKTEYFLLPRLSYVYKLSSKISSRISAGLGYKTPTLFTEKSEALLYQNIAQLQEVKSEQSLGSTADVNYKTPIGDDFFFTLNQLFFATQIDKPLVITPSATGNYFFRNEQKPVQSFGAETNVKLVYKEHLKLLAGYTYTNAKALYATGNQYLTLLPANKLNLALVYEKENVIKVGLEGYYSDRQYLSSGLRTPGFWEYGFLVEKLWEHFSVFANAENFTDQRQSRYAPVVNPPHNSPTFNEIWNHTEGFVLSLGLKFKL